MDNKNQTVTKVPVGRISINIYESGLPTVEMSGVITPNHIQMIMIPLRQAYARHLQKIGESNVKKAEEEKRLKLAEEIKIKEEKKVV